MARRGKAARRIGLALAGGGPFGAIYEIGALLALEESLGLDLNRLDCYVGVSAGSFIAAALANGIPVEKIYRSFIAGEKGEGAVAPRLFMRPAWREYANAALGARLPNGLFDNEPIHEYLARVFAQPGLSNDFRELRRPLFVVATDLDSGQSVSFGRHGNDAVPISKAVQASSALPGLFPPVLIGSHHYVDGALAKTMHASEALESGATLVIGVNPIVPYDADLAARRGARRRLRLVDGGFPVVLSQTFRTMIRSRMAVGLAGYRARHPDADVVVFEPEAYDSEIFFTNIFSYASRRHLCEHAYQRTRADLLRRGESLRPALSRHGLAIRRDRLEDRTRTLARRIPPASIGGELANAAGQLRDTLADLRRGLDALA